MIRTKQQKQEIVTRLTDKVRQASSIYLADFTGLNVARMTDLRRRLRSVDVEFVIVKNTLATRALEAATVQGLDTHLAGPTALVLAKDPVAAAKVLSDFAKEFERPAIKVGLMDGKPLTPADVKRLASLPSRAQLLSQLASSLHAPLAGFAGALQGLLQNLVGALEALRAQRSDAA
ncbi:MAG: 50S ribosomal protein L10 [Gemmatimonadales bacterium]